MFPAENKSFQLLLGSLWSSTDLWNNIPFRKSYNPMRRTKKEITNNAGLKIYYYVHHKVSQYIIRGQRKKRLIFWLDHELSRFGEFQNMRKHYQSYTALNTVCLLS